MVHALQESWRVLRPAGCLVDVRPITVQWPIEIVSGRSAVWAGRVEDTLGQADIQAADHALQHALRRRWFTSERVETYDYHWYWDTLAEMTAYLDERWYARLNVPERTLAQVATLLAQSDPGAQIRLRRRMVIARYRKGEPV